MTGGQITYIKPVFLMLLAVIKMKELLLVVGVDLGHVDLP